MKTDILYYYLSLDFNDLEKKKNSELKIPIHSFKIIVFFLFIIIQ